MAKVVLQSCAVILLLAVCAYQRYQSEEFRANIKKMRECEIQLEELRQYLQQVQFSKAKHKLFGKNEDIKRDILGIFRKFGISKVFFKSSAQDNFSEDDSVSGPNGFEIRFAIDEEEKLYEIIEKLREELGGILLVDEVAIDRNENQLAVRLKYRIFYPSEDLKKYVYVNNRRHKVQTNISPIFNLRKKNTHQLNGIFHYKIAYINGKPFRVGDTVGGHTIVKIYEDFILLRKGKKVLKMKIDSTW